MSIVSKDILDDGSVGLLIISFKFEHSLCFLSGLQVFLSQLSLLFAPMDETLVVLHVDPLVHCHLFLLNDFFVVANNPCIVDFAHLILSQGLSKLIGHFGVLSEIYDP